MPGTHRNLLSPPMSARSALMESRYLGIAIASDENSPRGRRTTVLTGVTCTKRIGRSGKSHNQDPTYTSDAKPKLRFSQLTER
jgi:hypothetical protein